MADCKFCGEPVGFLRSEHKECRAKRDGASQKLIAFFPQALRSDLPAHRFHDLAQQLAAVSFVKGDELRTLARTGLEKMVAAALEDGLISDSEDDRILAIADAFAIERGEFFGTAAGKLLRQAQVLRMLDQGKLPPRLDPSEPIAVNMQRGETPLCIFRGVQYFTEKTRKLYHGRSQGVSLRIAKGVYYRVGASRGEAIHINEMVREGSGSLIITDRSVYFAGGAKSVRIPATKIVAVTPHIDGISIMRDAASAKPQVFKLDDPWFAVNVITRLNQIDD